MNGEIFIDFLKQMKRKFKRFLLFMDKASWHREHQGVRKYLEKNKECIKAEWFPTASPEMKL